MSEKIEFGERDYLVERIDRIVHELKKLPQSVDSLGLLFLLLDVQLEVSQLIQILVLKEVVWLEDLNKSLNFSFLLQ